MANTGSSDEVLWCGMYYLFIYFFNDKYDM